MFFRQPLGCLLLLGALFFAGSCSKAPTTLVDRIAILPIENLTSEPALNWVSSAAQNALQRELTGAGNLVPLAVPSTREARLVKAGRALEAYLSGDASLLRIHAVIEDLQHLKASADIDISGPRQKGVLPLLEQLAKAVDASARPFSTGNDAAFELYAKGSFEEAIAADPGFGAAYLNWLVQLRGKNDPEAGTQVLAKAKAQGTRLNDLDRAQIEVASSWLNPSDKNARRAALMNLAAIVKYDVQLMRDLAESAQTARNFKASAEWLQKALALEPGNTEIWNSLAYAHALGGDVSAAEKAIEQYRKLAPNDVNPFDSMGEIYFLCGKFAEAERSFTAAFEKAPQYLGGAEMYKAALSHLMTGDEKGADALFAKYLDYKKSVNDPEPEIRLAYWEFLTGRRTAAIGRISKLTSPRARGQHSLMLLLNGDRAGARKQAEAAMMPPNPDRQAGPVALFLSGPAGSLQQWQEAATKFFGPQLPQIVKNQFIAYALAAQNNYADIASLLGPQVMEANPLAESLHKEMVAASLVAAGKVADAQPLVATFPIPDAASENVLTSLVFPRQFVTRVVIFEKQGKAAEAKAMMDLAAKFAPR